MQGDEEESGTSHFIRRGRWGILSSLAFGYLSGARIRIVFGCRGPECALPVAYLGEKVKGGARLTRAERSITPRPAGDPCMYSACTGGGDRLRVRVVWMVRRRVLDSC